MNTRTRRQVSALVMQALAEDVGSGDRGAELLIPPALACKAIILAKAAGIVAGLLVAREVFAAIDRRLRFRPCVPEGAQVKSGAVLARLQGNARSILKGERLALNFLQRLSGIATLTSKFVARVRKFGTFILDTRKTTPLLRCMEKYAVRVGGGANHRMGLFDGVMVKDNYLALLRISDEQSLIATLKAARAKTPRGMLFEAEAQSLEDLRPLLAAGVPVIMLDNMPVRQTRQAVNLIRASDRVKGRRTIIEASGGITLKNVAAVASTGVYWISVGALTHSAPPLNMSLEVCPGS